MEYCSQGIDTYRSGPKEFRMRRTIVLMSLFLAGAASISAASAQENNCLAEVDRLANSLGMKGEASPQATVPRSGASSESLAQSGGVIQPPDVGSARVLEPPKGTADGMNTAPAMPQQDGAPQGTVPNGSTGQSRMSAAERAQLEALLLGARNAGRQGDTAECQERLEEARDLARESGADSRM
jgi:hypothetical protein